jgi:hypothetical protein
MQIPRKGQSGKLLFGRMAFETLLFWDSVVTNATSLLSNPLHYELKRFWSGAAQILKQSREPRGAASGAPQVQKDIEIIKYSQAVLERATCCMR